MNIISVDNPVTGPSLLFARPSLKVAPTIRFATTEEELETIYRFRYAIYVEEMHRKQEYADHQAKRICDPLDPGSYVLGAWEGEEIAGTLRISFVRWTRIGEYFEMYHVGRLPEIVQKHTSITTRLMIQPRLRQGTLAVRLAQAAYSFGLEHEIKTDLIDCNSHLIPFFTRLGYRLYRDDHDYLQQIRSPFLPILREWLSQHHNLEKKGANS